MDSYEVRLDALDHLGNVCLPAIRDNLNAALRELELAIEWIKETFDADAPYTNRGRLHLFAEPGRECYVTTDFMRRVFQDNAENVDLAAQAIREIALRYRQVDGQA